VATRSVILAAGRGVRMGGREPKCLVEVHDHGPLLAYLLRGLAISGSRDLLVVTGFAADRVKRFVSEHWDGDEPSFAFNARYASWGNFHSVRLALETSPGANVLVVNSDVIVPPPVFERALRSPADLALAVQRRSKLDPEDMRVELAGDRVTAVGKHLPLDSSQGEFCGVSLIRPLAARRYLDAATAREWRAETQAYYEDVYAEILPGLDARATAVGDDEYAEVDEPRDLPSAAAIIEQHRDAWGGAPNHSGRPVTR
jgi:choline kinase